ncbi:hypothetical protein CMV_004176 [Castanea mollissima]|uniref:Uncharacterized protein n=1 Tax=Castanea mollissima TaxID=60419 RepID=A0A8J4RUP3_9ROSI|nr:hypothetical protein CMV_004176 [Castanea mollissima]
MALENNCTKVILLVITKSIQTEFALGQSCMCSFLKWRTMSKGWVLWWSTLRGMVESEKRDCALHCMIVLQYL